ncbi:hypothetical protein [Acetobacterium wieringae]|uniref:hypothetical protein n=1 Tax=Acetobacterium wieringae TaxID=52694 RepID=UPI0026EA785E|nr:hypothetical protein [Acetobacterium wieringae]
MGKHCEETRIINQSKDQCEERLLAFDTGKYELKNHIVDKEESHVVLHTKIIFAANGQRITIKLQSAGDQKTEVCVRSELISNVMMNDRGVNKKNINAMFGYLNEENEASQNRKADSARNDQHPKPKRKLFFWAKNATDLKMSMMASYLGGYPEFEKPLKGTMEIHEAGIDFVVMGPKFSIPFFEIKSVAIASAWDIEKNPAWWETCFKDELKKDKTDHEKASKNKLVVIYQNDLGQTQCIFRADTSYEAEKSVVKAQMLIQEMMGK